MFVSPVCQVSSTRVRSFIFHQSSQFNFWRNSRRKLHGDIQTPLPADIASPGARRLAWSNDNGTALYRAGLYEQDCFGLRV